MEEYAKMDRKALRAAYKNEADESKKAAIAKALAEKDDTTTGEGMQDRINAAAADDPGVKALVEQLAGERKVALEAKAKLSEVADRLAKIEQERDLAAFVADAQDVYSAEEAQAQYKALGGGVARAMVAELRKKGVSMSSAMFKGGTPAGKSAVGSTNASATGLTMFQGMAYRDLDVASRARQIQAEIRAKEPTATNTDIATRALKQALSEKGR